MIPFGLEDCIFKENFYKKIPNFGSEKRNFSSNLNNLKLNIRNFFYGQNVSTLRNYRYLEKLLTNKSKVLIIGGGAIGFGMQKFYSACNKENINLQSEICQEDYADNEDYNQSVDNLESQGCDCR